MADNKTEKPTPKRREEARKKGQMARSMDLNSATVLLVGVGTLAIVAPSMLHQMTDVVREGIGNGAHPGMASKDAGGSLAGWAMRSTLTMIAPILAAAAAAGVAASMLQNRPRVTATAIKPQWSRVNPRTGLKRLAGPQLLFESGKALSKAGVVSVAAFLAIWPRLPRLAALTGVPPGAMLVELARTVLTLSLYVGGAFMLLAAVDYAWQKRRHEKSMKMTKEEVKQETRQSDLAPEIRGAIRRRQFAQARNRMIADVATADVVVTNPTHFAVALKYDGTKPAPELVAKGADLVAKAIRETAEAASVPVLTNPPLARALHKEVEIGQQIPEEFFQAVAEVLAFVYRAAGRRRAAA
ncbi:MAG: flagellar biosynthesis protein FlhB [Gaiellales bacterium]